MEMIGKEGGYRATSRGEKRRDWQELMMLKEGPDMCRTITSNSRSRLRQDQVSSQIRKVRAPYIHERPEMW